MSRPYADPLTDHSYDGIREYDNPTPGWWHLIFLGTVVFSVFYAIFWHASPMAWTEQEAWAAAQEEEYAKLFGSVGELKPDQATLLDTMTNDKFMQVARGKFIGTCAACHGSDGGGLPASGVNLTDDHYKNVKKIEDIFTVITNGAAAGAMPAHESRFSVNERVLLAAYVASLRGTNVPGGQAPAGDVIAPWPKPAPKPSGTAPAPGK